MNNNVNLYSKGKRNKRVVAHLARLLKEFELIYNLSSELNNKEITELSYLIKQIQKKLN